jgi:hypothetical protein
VDWEPSNGPTTILDPHVVADARSMDWPCCAPGHRQAMEWRVPREYARLVGDSSLKENAT